MYMKAALYIRVSTEEQTEGFSLSAQLTQLKKYCEVNEIEIFNVYADEGISGQKENRPEFQKMLKDAREHRFNIILVHKYDRFARKVELSQRVKTQLKENGIGLISITEPLEDSPMGFFVGGLHDLLAEYYVRNLSVESKKGHVERARQGLHNGSVPFGYKIDRNTEKMVINEEQADVVKMIFDLYNHKGYGSTKIAKVFNENKVTSALREKWSHYTINRILKNVKYIGKIEYDGEIYEGHHEPIISEEEFAAVSKNMGDRTWKRGYRGCNFEKFLLLGLAKCGDCNCAITMQVTYSKTQRRKSSQYYYKCNHRAHLEGCPNSKHYAAEKLEKAVLSQIKSLRSKMPPEIMIQRKSPLESLQANRKIRIETEAERAKSAYLSGVFTLDEYKEIKYRCENELAEIEKTVSVQPEEENRSILKQRIISAWDELVAADSISEKRRILSTFIHAIYLYKDHVDVIFYI